MDIVRPMAFGSVIVAGLLLLGCDVKFQRNSERLHNLQLPVHPSETISPGDESRRYDFLVARANATGMMLPNAQGEAPDERVNVVFDKLGDDRWELSLNRAKDFPEDDFRYDQQQQRIRFAPGQLIPYYGHLFRFSFDGQRAQLEECTEQLPSLWLPAANSRVITLHGSEATFFQQAALLASVSQSEEDHFETMRLVKIETDPEGTRAQIVRSRMIVRNGDGVNETALLDEPKEEWVGVGSNLVVDDQLVRVKQIVPPVEMEGGLIPVGWIELELVDLSDVEMHRAML
ncbi:hypothetical protein [Bremerella sp. P1]|uniref:hypothetical protein n=1 Tax=Bremerella sp. P1 TaxID=3026424 RepID=UPI0023686406|nr:hypothetical protein [Bremerella sp. P1]WDI44568.1 hypothetical protein PSR63_11550 [Bremerella sp. P1]